MEGLQPLHRRVAGIDVHRMLQVATLLIEQPEGSIEHAVRQFGGFRRDCRALAAWLAEAGVELVVIHQMMLDSVPTDGGEQMRTTVNIDDELLAKATRLAGPMDRTAILSEGLKALIERESAKRLARLGGTQPALKAAPRRRTEKAA